MYVCGLIKFCPFKRTSWCDLTYDCIKNDGKALMGAGWLVCQCVTQNVIYVLNPYTNLTQTPTTTSPPPQKKSSVHTLAHIVPPAHRWLEEGGGGNWAEWSSLLSYWRMGSLASREVSPSLGEAPPPLPYPLLSSDGSFKYQGWALKTNGAVSFAADMGTVLTG